MKKLFSLAILFLCSLFLFACGKKTNTAILPSPTPRLVEVPLESRPYVSLIPREDGHLLYLKIDKIPDNVTQLDYELLYVASDNGNEIEKGAGDTIRDITPSLERKILLGTESCTNGCKYKYDNGVYGGTVTLIFTTSDSQVFTYESQFSLKTGKEIKKEGGLSLSTENLTIKAQPADNNFYILLRNFGSSDLKVITTYTVSSSAASTAKFISIEPPTVTKKDQLLTGEYQLK